MKTFRECYISILEKLKTATPEELRDIMKRPDLSPEELEKARDLFILSIETADSKEAKRYQKAYVDFVKK